VDGEGYTLQTYDDFGPVSDTTYGNKIYNHRYFRSTVTTAGCYSLTVTPVAPTATADVQIAFVGRESIDINYGGSDAAETVSISFTDNEMAVFNVSAFSDNVSFSVLFTSTPSACTP
jgi:hypothetical protein